MNKIQTTEQSEEKHWLENIYLGDKMPELTLKAVMIGAFLCVILISSNIYMGLKTSFTEGGSILSAILAFTIVKAFKGKFSVLENNISQTMASAAASIGIMVSVIPALILMGYKFTGFQLFLWIFLVSILGVLFAVPLRKQLVVIEKLTFPSGTACAETITAMHADGKDAVRKTKYLSIAAIISGAVTWFRDGVPSIIPYITDIPGRLGIYELGKLNVGINWSPMLLGVGFLIGPRIGTSLLIGAVTGWIVLAQFLAENKIIAGIGYRDISSWTMWLAIALMVSSGLTSLVLKWKIIARAFTSMKRANINPENRTEFPFSVWLAGMLITAAGIAVIMQYIFHIPAWMSIVAIIVSYIFAVVAIRAYGETDINPVGAMGHATQILYGVTAPGQIITNLMAAGITAAGADQSADMMQDLKTGYLLGATPKKQTYAQLLGAIVGSIVAVPVFLAVANAYGIGSKLMPAPSAVLWKGMAEVLSKGISSLPAYADYGIILGIITGIILTLLEKTRFAKFVPSPVGMGIAIVVPAFFSVTMFLGSMIKLICNKKFPHWCGSYGISLASGAIAGEGIIGVVIAVLSTLGIL